ncbi:MAG: T9SS type A sorting domain-containing protein, partial [Saprospiraceae bacterium]|nr:T9SS type A sorting domain-containing protein [Saprospiraceae bacterium]
VIDLQGKIVRDETAPGPMLTLRKEGLPTGMYLFKLDQKGVLIGSGKLIVQD